MLIYSDIYGIGHTTFLLITVPLIIIGCIAMLKWIKKEKTKEIIIRISGIFLLISIIINRISTTYYDVVVNKLVGYTWLNVIPNTFCGLYSLVLSLTIIFGKKDHVILHAIAYSGFIGGILAMFYPAFLSTDAFVEVRSYTSLIHHALMVWIILACMLTKYMKPTMSKWCVLPLSLCIVMTIGLIEKELLKFPTAMQINDPLVSSLPVLSSWYMIGLLIIPLHFTFLVVYEKTVNHKTFKEMFKHNN